MKAIDFVSRQEEVKEQLLKHEIDLFLIPPSINFGYLFKGFFTLSERLICGIINQLEDSMLVAPSFENERMKIETTFDDVIAWKEEENPYEILKSAITFKVDKIALEPSTPFEVFKRLKNQFPQAKFIDGGSIIKKMRAVKTEDEIERMKKAAVYTKDGILNTLNILEEGQTEIDILKVTQKEMSNLSNEAGWALVQIGEHSAVPHGHPSKKKLKLNDVILIDAGTTCDHYFSDITVTTVFGKAQQEFLKVYEIVEEANEAALEASREGVPAEDVDSAAREIISNAGYGEYFTHRLGHGLGLEVHEEPYIVKGNSDLLVSGNVHTDEPGIYLPNKFGIRIEDDILVGAKSKRLVEFDRYIWK